MSDTSTSDEPQDPRIPKKDHSRLIHVYVGKERQHFTLQARPLREVSELVEKTLTTEDAEVATHIIVLDDEDPAAFEMFIHWLYTSKLPVAVKGEPDHDEREYLELAKAWVLGQRLQCPKFQNAAMDALVARRDEDFNLVNVHPLSKTVEYIYSRTKKDSSLRHFIYDIYTQLGYDNRLNLWGNPARVPLELILEVADTFYDWMPTDFDDKYTCAKKFYV
ncbi:hypothetical protein BJX65DRAFT_311395 [Aspergillus insuetus]